MPGPARRRRAGACGTGRLPYRDAASRRPFAGGRVVSNGRGMVWQVW